MRVIKISYNFDFFLVEKTSVRFRTLEVNTNKVKDDTLYYTFQYVKLYKNNIKKLLSKENVSTVFYKDFDSYLLMNDVIDVSDIRFDIKKSLSTKVLDLLLTNNNLKILHCYFIPDDYMNKFKEKSVSVVLINDLHFTPDFVKSNDLNDLMNIYYKNVISFYNEEEVNNNLECFLKVNQSLKLIHLYFYSNDVISFITTKLNDCKVSDVDIFIHQNDKNKEDILNNSEYIRKVNKKYSNSSKEIKIIYSNEFFKDNIFRELTINGIKLCMVAVFYIGVVFVISDKYQEYVTIFNLRLLEQSLAEENDGSLSVDEMDDTEVNTPEEPEVLEPTNTSSPTIYVNKYANIPTSFDSLKSINNEVIGWVSVNNTKINYPVVHHSDNKYYLEHDIYGKKVITGWIFMDYRNDINFNDQNTIVYGHNTISGYMFGDLKNTSNKNWYTNPDNQIVTFKTLEGEKYFKIFSIYRTNYTTDYLNINFYNDDYFMEFVNMVKARSVHDFNVDVRPGDKILTLSSCTGSNNRRIVVHAVMLK